jgi:hypothetical protein
MKTTHPELHACLCFLAMPHEEKVRYLGPSFKRQWFEWSQARTETSEPLKVLALIASEESQRRFQIRAADEALGGIFAVFELMAADEVVWSAPSRWSEDDRGSLGVLDVWDALRQLALVALRELDWPAGLPGITCEQFLRLSSRDTFPTP